MVSRAGLEPATPGLKGRCSPSELTAHPKKESVFIKEIAARVKLRLDLFDLLDDPAAAVGEVHAFIFEHVPPQIEFVRSRTFFACHLNIDLSSKKLRPTKSLMFG